MLQHELVVLGLVTGFSHVRRVLFAEYRFYDRQALATNRALVRKSVTKFYPEVCWKTAQNGNNGGICSKDS